MPSCLHMSASSPGPSPLLRSFTIVERPRQGRACRGCQRHARDSSGIRCSSAWREFSPCVRTRRPSSQIDDRTLMFDNQTNGSCMTAAGYVSRNETPSGQIRRCLFRAQEILQPASTTRHCPVISALSSEARKTAVPVNSLGSSERPSAVRSWWGRWSVEEFRGTALPRSGRKWRSAHPSGTPAMRMPSWARSRCARYVGLSLIALARARPMVKLGSRASPACAAARASSNRPRWAKAAER
jgi:hypothetical protein